MKRFLVICGNQAETKYEFEEFIQSKERYVTSVNNNEFIVELGNENYIFTDLGNLKSFSKLKCCWIFGGDNFVYLYSKIDKQMER
ncbi:hypothetical protein K9J90_001005 [Listeria innocua]|uniref:hypothetical protein n=1 Tax=Listeria innocua TaxID=1642 RepID=UPI001D56F20E|nr:hypothetical protein [Listeria innocua]EIB7809789.1 hypothetical protein [Listeria innocua]EIB7898186.1 hypothetical protein [Listeria innocua]EJH3233639.1 hypothetical protein [Listeria innocua]EJH4623230.1 hypothetical protein [Listeria innocua]